MPAPPQATPAKKTAQTRAWDDQVEKLTWLWKLKGISSADFIGPLIAEALDAEFEALRPIVEQLKAQETGNPVG